MLAVWILSYFGAFSLGIFVMFAVSFVLNLNDNKKPAFETLPEYPTSNVIDKLVPEYK